jgi:hypothetical protein
MCASWRGACAKMVIAHPVIQKKPTKRMCVDLHFKRYTSHRH